MEQKTILAENIESADINARLDNSCKRILANKVILAWIMKNTVEEYRDLDVNEIVERYIEGDPVIAGLAVHRDEKSRAVGGCVRGDDTVDKSIMEGTIVFDIRFRAKVPHSGEHVTLILNVEAQNNFYPGYPLIKRGIYYCCRLVSGQYGTEFVGSHYEKIRKVYSIWICINPPKYRRGSINKYEMKEINVIGNISEPVDNYDLLTAVVVCLGGTGEQKEKGLIDLLSTLFSTEMDVEHKKEYLEQEYGIAMTRQLEQEVTQMCNYSEGVEEKGIQKGTIAGMEKKLIQIVCRKLQKGKSAEVISDDLEENITEIQRICDAAEEYAPEYDCEKIYKRLQELKSQ